MTSTYKYLFIAALFAWALTLAADAQDGPKDAVVLIVRHAEDGGTGRDLAPRGHERAEAYKNYFLKFAVDSKRLEPDVVLAAKDSKKSHRPRLTVEPFAKAAKLKIDTRFGNYQSDELAADLRANQRGKVILISWRHGNIPALLRALGANPASLLPRGKWPDPVFDWVIMLSYDQDGRLIPERTSRINEHLMPGDSQETWDRDCTSTFPCPGRPGALTPRRHRLWPRRTSSASLGSLTPIVSGPLPLGCTSRRPFVPCPRRARNF